jgi:hypothetical protein
VFTLVAQTPYIPVTNGTSLVVGTIPRTPIDVSYKSSFLIAVTSDQAYTAAIQSPLAEAFSMAPVQNIYNGLIPGTVQWPSAQTTGGSGISTIYGPAITITMCSTTAAQSHFSFDVDSSDHINQVSQPPNPTWTLSSSLFRFGGGALLSLAPQSQAGAASPHALVAPNPAMPLVVPGTTNEWSLSLWVYVMTTSQKRLETMSRVGIEPITSCIQSMCETNWTKSLVIT